MARLIYLAIMSLDGYVEDEGGKFDWAEPDEEVHTFINNLVRDTGTYLYGRRMYKTMVAWETLADVPDQPPAIVDFAHVWQAAEKVVYSTTLDQIASGRTRLERRFDPATVRDLKQKATRDLRIGGSGLAAEAFRAELVDECHLFLVPAAVGRGKHGLPMDVRLALELVEERRFRSGFVYLRYAVKA